MPLFRDFDKLPLIKDSRAQLMGTSESLHRGVVSKDKKKLLSLLVKHRYDPDRGLYIPLSDRLDLVGKHPYQISENIEVQQPFPLCFFSNALSIPPGYGSPDFDAGSAPKPIRRVTNGGYIIVTLEEDNTSPDGLDVNLAWTRGVAEERGVLFRVDQALRRFQEYRGYSVVYSGNRSLHFHFLFSTAHISSCDSSATVAERLQQKGGARMMGEVHHTYWEKVQETFNEVVGYAVAFDTQLKNVTQWRRTPWGVRIITPDDKIIFDFEPGTQVPQLVIREDILLKAPRGHNGFLISPDFSPASSRPFSNTKARPRDSQERVGDEVLEEVRRFCAEEWGAYPKPASVQAGSEGWLIRFHNSPTDQTPSTIVKGEYHRLLLGGVHAFSRKFFLPGGMTADELVEHARDVCRGNLADEEDNEGQNGASDRSWRRTDPFIDMMERSFSRAAEGKIDPKDVLSSYRKRMGSIIGNIRGTVGGNKAILIKSVGIGKTTALGRELRYEMLDDAMWEEEDVQRFCAFAFRSAKQARDKAEEFRDDSGCGAVVITSFWKHYEAACSSIGVKMISRSELKKHEDGPVLAIRERQPEVFAALEVTRKSLWDVSGSYNSGVTILFTTHAQVMTWRHAWTTRIWYHPKFSPELSFKEQQYLKDDFQLSKVVFDEPEIDDILNRCCERTYEAIQDAQTTYSNWRNMPRREREVAFTTISKVIEADIKSFDEFDAWMRYDLSKLELITVDFERIPFGVNNGGQGIYQKMNGKHFYIGVKDWMFSSSLQINFLTTEDLVSDVISLAYAKEGQSRNLSRYDLEVEGYGFPIIVPLTIDQRASKARLGELVSEIIERDPRAEIIADTLKLERVTNFSRMKGSNGFVDNSTYIVLLHLGAEQYAQINALGVYMNDNDIIPRHYRDQIYQACGRNRGFRGAVDLETTTTVLASLRLLRTVLRKLPKGRYQLVTAEAKRSTSTAQ